MTNMLLAQVPPIPDIPAIESSHMGADALATVLAGSGIFLGGFAVLWTAMALIGLVFLIWWIVLIIDLANREFKDKTIWLIVMIAGLILGFVWLVDIIYYFTIVKKGVGTKN